jgi:predicted acetyltransferase
MNSEALHSKSAGAPSELTAQSSNLPIPWDSLAFGDVTLQFSQIFPGNDSRGFVHYYHFRIHDPERNDIGAINFRVGDTDHVRLFAGHIGFEIKEPFRGRRYAEQACRALAPFVATVYKSVLLTCDPTNVASMRTIERLPATFLDEVLVPPHAIPDGNMNRRKRRYKWTLAAGPRA